MASRAKKRFIEDTQTVAKDSQSDGPKVIAAGMWRTGTSSLQVAFEQMLQPALKPSMHGAYIMPHVTIMKDLNHAMLEHNHTARQRILYDVFEGYNASSDFPGHAFLDDLLDMYPNAKVVLNKRHTPQEWERSVRSTLAFFSTWTYHLITYWIPICYWHHMIYRNYGKLAKRRYGVDDIFSTDCYLRHNEWVRQVAAARAKQVLEWEPDDGWAPLCSFLGCKVPEEPFPKTNETAEIKALTTIVIKRGLMVWAGVLTGAVIAIVALKYTMDHFT